MFRIFIFISLFAISLSETSADLFKCIDQENNVHFSDTNGPHCVSVYSINANKALDSTANTSNQHKGNTDNTSLPTSNEDNNIYVYIIPALAILSLALFTAGIYEYRKDKKIRRAEWIQGETTISPSSPKPTLNEISTSTKAANRAISPPPKTSQFELYISGQYSLAVTYWVYGVLASFVWMAIIGAIHLEHGNALQAFMFKIWSLYYIANAVAIWNAAGNYRGNPAWKYISKAIALISAIIFIRFLLD